MTESESSLKRWALSKITFEDGKFVHTSIQNFFSQNGAEKQFTIAQGLDWNDEDSIDDTANDIFISSYRQQFPSVQYAKKAP